MSSVPGWKRSRTREARFDHRTHTMTRRALTLVLLFLCSAAPAAADDPPADALPGHVREFLNSHCLGCHGARKSKAKLDLSRFETVTHLAAAPRIWEKVLTRIRDGEMPPEDEEPPPDESRARFVEWIDSSLRSAACEDGISPGPAMIGTFAECRC